MGPSYAVNNGAAMSNGGNNVAIGLASLGFILCFHALGFTVDLGAYAWQGLCTQLVGVLVRNTCGAPRKFCPPTLLGCFAAVIGPSRAALDKFGWIMTCTHRS